MKMAKRLPYIALGAALTLGSIGLCNTCNNFTGYDGMTSRTYIGNRVEVEYWPDRNHGMIVFSANGFDVDSVKAVINGDTTRYIPQNMTKKQLSYANIILRNIN